MLHAACSVQNNVKDIKDIKTSHNRFLTDFLEFISLLSGTSKMCTNYNVDSNMKSFKHEMIRFLPKFQRNVTMCSLGNISVADPMGC